MNAETAIDWTADDEAAILDAIDKWVEGEVRPIAREYDQADEYPHHLVEQMKELGLFGAIISPEYGGLGLPSSTYAKIVIKVASVWMAPSGIFNSHLIMASAIERAGTEAQKAEWLPKMATGELRGGIALTEPNAGTDLQAIRTRADKTDEGYRLNGTKTWITNSLNGNCLMILAKTDTEAQPRHKGMSAFLTKKGEGYEVSKKLKKLGYRSIDSCELLLDNKLVPEDALLGGTEGRGMQQVLGGLELGRINVAARGAGIAEGALKMATRYAQERQTFGKPIAEHQAIQLKLGEMASKVAASKLLIEDAARKYDSGQRCDMEAGMAKYFATETGVECAQEAMRIFGGYSYSTEYEIERFYRDAMLMCIGEGTNEMQRIIVAKQLIERNPI
ncbi:acyl-CoA/acyl-ACP dehydrogenase [Ponticoccus sp. SC2-23]|uniref:acyl-CoA dehydrogenase family protein n=1 Tax=Alexandriicola marinus TaxID=2081710 RepID=UPI000FD76653|nr:acyl-CoA dehydrogenase family protein [Alexandriicola marinus]MBM1221407.1 acyl-CoA/acyl-ACP dehydrogenase [Ponticoccus sp. SC6-9]MBM1226448.1 acyl-CoA/acyl-ACP dehydrogenase [Ponticoccus sp. SC6-15]MBM1230399.1 acyl-CoA/acyl-ACP dehydrogenase [Ponticoccus sp. SC6-38]MBM1234922.1 acyl-CoA/acyl-ACP dehydrogenase [Ponticoccus sp. SC6-45]MBM1239420.1 acyl-CoA/acyl-ACP dehydrogenase [Ponticoccus sp. SC6-49]MBM1243202.1 acyl-CoA/acyl-ACP dehydrogenase [Ponticoccus sp. SC2-64]MBM1248446.1 acyl-